MAWSRERNPFVDLLRLDEATPIEQSSQSPEPWQREWKTFVREFNACGGGRDCDWQTQFIGRDVVWEGKLKAGFSERTVGIELPSPVLDVRRTPLGTVTAEVDLDTVTADQDRRLVFGTRVRFRATLGMVPYLRGSYDDRTFGGMYFPDGELLELTEPTETDPALQTAAGAIAALLDVTGMVGELAQCTFEEASWGGYDVKVRVAAEFVRDRKARLFELTGGRFAQRIDDTLVQDTVLTREWILVERSGTVSPSSAEEAFGKGVPFFISDTRVDSPTSLRFTVLSNPATPDARATPFLDFRATEPLPVGPEVQVQLLFILGNEPEAIRSKTAPQEKIWRFGALKKTPAETKFSLVRKVSHWSGRFGFCLASNEVRLSY